ncbi:hypothetical protein LTS17_004910 [Exophiala oligosperma]
MSGGNQVEAPYGTWKSPINPEDFAATGSVVLDQPCVNRTNGKIYLLESRPDEAGRGVIVEYYNGRGKDVLPKQYNALSQVHEYGGASYIINELTGHIIFTDWDTKGVFDLDPETGDTKPIVDADEKVYYADFNSHPNDSKWFVSIKEDHRGSNITDIQNTLVAIDASTKQVHTLTQGADFYTYPRFSPDGKSLCWIQWNFPNMPWDNTELYIADWEDGVLRNQRCVAGQQRKAAITQPTWSPDNVLFYSSDETDYWQLYSHDGSNTRHINLSDLETAEFGMPDWFLGGSMYGFVTPSTIVACYNKENRWHIISIDVESLQWHELRCPFVDISRINALKPVSPTSFVVVGATISLPVMASVVDIDKGGIGSVLKKSTVITIPEGYVSEAQAITFPRIHGPGGGEAHGLFFPPRNPNFRGPSGSLPPLIVATHGGPTLQQGSGFDLRDHGLITRGYAILQVNYVGSSGYGRPYRNLLAGQWGVSDIADAVSGVEYLAKQGLIDRSRVGITGHSAGGYNTMCGITMYPDIWACAVAESGISDMALLVAETHKFESQYLEPLCFPPGTSKDDRERILKERSPINHASQVKAPTLIINGSDDAIVPPNQAYNLAEMIKAAGTEVEVKVYDGEGHIFSKGDTLSDIETRRFQWFERFLSCKD